MIGLIVEMINWVDVGSNLYVASEAEFGGLGKGGLITIIIVAILFIVTMVWIFRNLKKRD